MGWDAWDSTAFRREGRDSPRVNTALTVNSDRQGRSPSGKFPSHVPPQVGAVCALRHGIDTGKNHEANGPRTPAARLVLPPEAER